MQTIKLYEADAYISEFKAKVLSCEKLENHYDIILDRTAFFPEGGGQEADTGVIGDARVTDVQINGGVIIHKTDSPLPLDEVNCQIDWDKRYRRMQNHSGEHLLSGLAHSLYGCTNVGFHMGSEITVDFDKALTADELSRLEMLANEGVYKNVNITAEYPDPEKLGDIDYRSKLELTQDVRIVTIDGYDICACCAPHVKMTGEIGMVKILASMRHRGGVRLTILCGKDAFEDYCVKTRNLYEIAVTLCAKHNEELEAFRKLCGENSELKQKCAALSKELTQLKAKDTEQINGIYIYFDDSGDMQAARTLALQSAKEHDGISAVFSGKEGSYKYAVASTVKSVRALTTMLNGAFSGRGGGSDELSQGSLSATKSEIEKFLAEQGC